MHTTRARTLRTASAVALATALALAACGSDGSESASPDGDAEVADGAAVDLEDIRAELDAVEFESNGVPSGPLLGEAPLAEAAAPADDAQLGGDPPSPDCEELGDCSDGAPVVPDDSNGSNGSDGFSGEALEPVVFQPVPEWAPFCTVLAEIERRDFPTDPTEALRVVDAWLAVLERHVPAQIGADFAVLDAALDEAAAADDVTLLETSSPEIDDAAERIGTAVDAECAGR